MIRKMHTKIKLLLTAFVMSLLMPFSVLSQSGPVASAAEVQFAQGKPFDQDVVITAYYSPVPGQCCYVRGNFAADVELNGKGTNGADGTEVYAGMAAAPSSYPFGTRIKLPGIGTVTVHDRGGAITEWKDAHRIDLWVGTGEEGLARALAFGVRRVHATVYPQASQQPAESFILTSLPSPPSKLRAFLSENTTLFDIHAALGDHTASVQFLQKRLKDLGYFDDQATGLFGPVTQKSLQAFYRDMQVTEPTDQLTERGAAFLEAAFSRIKAVTPVASPVSPGSAPLRIAEAQRTLHFLGFYKGRMNGAYDDTFRKAILEFQKSQKIIASDHAPGAGRIGPQTRQTIVMLWKRKHAELGAGRLLATRRIDQLLAERGYDIHHFFGTGDRGDSVRLLQKFLVSKKYLAADGITGTFGTRTEQALTAYQRHSGIIADLSDPGAGFAGPATLARFRRDVRASLLQIVRARGWAAI